MYLDRETDRDRNADFLWLGQRKKKIYFQKIYTTEEKQYSKMEEKQICQAVH